jgi:hypothetical protein
VRFADVLKNRRLQLTVSDYLVVIFGCDIVEIFKKYKVYKGNCSSRPTTFPGLSYEDEARHEKALVWAGHVTTQKLAVFDSYSSRGGVIFSKQINSQKTSQSILYYLCVERSLARIS